LVSGANGFVGTAVCARLPGRVLAMVRAADAAEAERRLHRAWWRHPALARRIGVDVIPVAGDVTAKDLDLGDAWAEARGCTHVVHTAALIRFDASRDDLMRVNLDGTVNMLKAASAMPDLRRFLHLSTAFCTLTPANNAYEESKAQAEAAVKAWGGPWTIVRPSMVVGDSSSGEVRSFNTIYLPLRLFLTGKISTFPVRRDLPLDIVPVDHLARMCAALLTDPKAERAERFAVSGSASPTAGEMLDEVMAWAKGKGIRLRPPRFLPLGRKMSARLMAKQRGMAYLAPYLSERQGFPDQEGWAPPPWREYLPRLLDFAFHHGFMDLGDRTVHEHILWRMRSTRLPVDYWDLGEKRKHYTGQEARSIVLRATSALRGMGVGKGDRVAIIGRNSVSYMAAEMAIGLLGAVSVPLYRTAPLPEQARLIGEASCCLAFLGEESLLRRATDLGVPCASLREGAAGVPSWDEFLSGGREEEVTAPVRMDDPATIRFSSGTTAEAKGAVLSHACLRYCGEEMAAIPPWGTRTDEVRYLSFLPMNHIVEGVIVANGPFYAPARVTMYYLDDFWKLQEELPFARPTVFFAVPRFYEKLWDELCASKLGARAARQASEGRRTLLTRLAGKKLRRAAGLDECGHVIVGAAPCPAHLLEGLRCLGLEVNDAYGLTEAPLVAMNRPGRNEIGSVGELLPGTEARTEEGEILLRGPQVMTSYLDGGGLSDGWLPTGDLGRAEGGRLFIEGRKKDIIITSYGKNIHPAKVEAALRALPLVREAMLIGDARPYCAALVWVEGGTEGEAEKAVGAALAEINATLSPHEGVRRFLVMPYDLSVERGDLTPSLKLRRKAVAERHGAVIEGIYAEGGACSRVGESP
jgi:long-chain acyl-CoA synthetase